MKQATRPSLRHQRGVTLIESAIVTTIVALTASVVAPGMDKLKTRQQLTHAAAGFETDVQFARSAAVSRNASLRISFDNRNGATCYVVHTGAAGDCSCDGAGESVCSNSSEVLRSVRYPATSGVTLNANVGSIVFDPAKGTSTPAGTVKFIGRDGIAVHQVVNIMGRVRSCSPGKAVSGFKAC